MDRTPIEADTYKHPDIPGHMVFVRRFGMWREALQAQKDLPSPYTYRDRFGQWRGAVRRAGLGPRHLIDRGGRD